MNNLSKTLMTIAVAGSLLFGSTLSSQAANFVEKNLGGTLGGQRGTLGPGDKYDGPFEPDGELPIPGGSCQGSGTIKYLYILDYGNIYITLYNRTNGIYTSFTIDGAGGEFLIPLGGHLIKEAWLHGLWLNMSSNDGECEQRELIHFEGGTVNKISFPPPLAE